MSREHYGCEWCKAPSTKLPPSRLEIAAMILQGWASNPNVETLVMQPGERPAEAALRIADALIHADKQ